MLLTIVLGLAVAMVIEVISAGAAALGDMLWSYGNRDDFAQEITALNNYYTADYLNLAAVNHFRFESDGIIGQFCSCFAYQYRHRIRLFETALSHCTWSLP
jgi:hypothetical protein